jgi:hypothetical protein
MENNLEQISESGRRNDDSENQTEYKGIFYKIVDQMLRIRKAITDSQPQWYKDLHAQGPPI